MRTSRAVSSRMASSRSSPFSASRIALVASATTSRMRDASQNALNTCAVCSARSNGSAWIRPVASIPSLTRTASRISSTCCQNCPGSYPYTTSRQEFEPMSITAMCSIPGMMHKLPVAMRLVTYELHRGPRAGLVRDGGVVDLWDALGGEPPEGPTVGALLRHRGGQAAEAVGGPPVAALEEVRLDPPVTDPEKILCIGLNYRSHAEEAGLDPPDTPTFFAKFRNALAAPGAEVSLPRYSQKVDYEAEVAFVIGRRAKDVSEADALEHVAGYTLMNDLSARDYQFMTPQWLPGKVFDGAAPLGPALVTPDEAGAPDAIEISLTLNGETMQSASTADLIHSIPALVAHLSMLMTLEPGDIVATGTPAGVGSVRQPRVWLKAGDDVVVESPQLGRLETRLA